MLRVDDMNTHIYAHCFLYVITAKKKQDTLWKISVAVHILYYALQVSDIFILEFEFVIVICDTVLVSL